MQKQTEARNPRTFPFRAYHVEGAISERVSENDGQYTLIESPMDAYHAIRAHFRYPTLFGLTEESFDLCDMAVMLPLNDVEA